MALTDMIMQFPSPLNELPVWVFFILVLWLVVWKGIALWKSARLNHLVWFILLLVINTMGILEILYIFVFSRFKFNHLKMKKPKKQRKRNINSALI